MCILIIVIITYILVQYLHRCFNGPFCTVYIYLIIHATSIDLYLPSRELSYPIFGKNKYQLKSILGRDMGHLPGGHILYYYLHE